MEYEGMVIGLPVLRNPRSCPIDHLHFLLSAGHRLNDSDSSREPKHAGDGAGTIAQMPDSSTGPTFAAAAPARIPTPRHAAIVRLTHWITALSFVALLVSGSE